MIAPASRPHRRTRLIASLAVGLGSFGLALIFRLVLKQQSSDFDQIVIGARRTLAGLTPYTASPLPGLDWPIYYPMPALVLGLPFAAMSLATAHAVFSGISGGLFTWALSRDGDAKLFSLGTWPYILTVSLGQWGPLLMATSGIPMIAWLVIAKPNLGLALAAAYGTRWIRARSLLVNAGAIGALLVISWFLRPHWFAEWRALIRTPTPHIIVPLTAIGGPLLLLTLVRWRRPEARLIAALACVPQTFSSYDSLLVFLVPETRREALLLVAGTMCATLAIALLGTAPTYAETVRRFAPVRIALVYLPAVAIILRRPNVSPGAQAG